MKKIGITPGEKFGKIRLSEVFVSVQGEGPRTGEPTTFFRTAGCPLTCSGWGVETTLPDGRVVTGCDSPHSVFPELFMQKGWSTLLTSEEALERTPEWPKNICLTGGEPLAQRKALTPWLRGVVERGQTVDVFTNGVVVVPDELDGIWLHDSITYVMDYKPKWSGEGGKFKEENFSKLREKDFIKFVCKNREDYEEACGVVDSHPEFKGRWLMGVVLGFMKPETIVEWLLKDQRQDVHLNLQTQAYLGLIHHPSKKGGDTFDETERWLHRIV